MGESWHIILVLIPLIAGAIAVFFSFQLMRRYRMPFISSYFYYLVFLYIFGVYSLAGSGLMEQVLGRMDAQVRVIHTARFFTLLMGMPFLMLSKFMLIRSAAEFLGKKLRAAFTAPYFLVAVVLFVWYAFLVVRFTRFDIGEYNRLIYLQRWAFTAFMVLVYLSWALWWGTRSQRIPDPAQKKFLRLYLFWYLLYMIFTTVTLHLAGWHPVVPYIFLFLFLSWHLLPILFLSLYLEKHHAISPEAQRDFESRLADFASVHEITRRELEVIRLICKGWSNQEISDNLFISLQTVKDHVHHIFVKTGVKNRVQLTNMIRMK